MFARELCLSAYACPVDGSGTLTRVVHGAVAGAHPGGVTPAPVAASGENVIATPVATPRIQTRLLIRALPIPYVGQTGERDSSLSGRLRRYAN
jgi:hypothetical protein